MESGWRDLDEMAVASSRTRTPWTKGMECCRGWSHRPVCSDGDTGGDAGGRDPLKE